MVSTGSDHDDRTTKLSDHTISHQAHMKRLPLKEPTLPTDHDEYAGGEGENGFYGPESAEAESHE